MVGGSLNRTSTCPKMNATHLFMPGHTIDAVLKLHNGHGITPTELKWLRQEFNRLNGQPLVRPGQRYIIPLLHDADSEGGLID